MKNPIKGTRVHPRKRKVGLVRSAEASVKKNDVWWRRLDSNQRPTPRDSLAVPFKESRDPRSGEAIAKKNDVLWRRVEPQRPTTARGHSAVPMQRTRPTPSHDTDA